MKLEKFLRNIASGLTLGLIIIIQGCEKPGMFTEMSSDETGIVFSNDITEDGHNNIMTYEYTYNGAGVAVGTRCQINYSLILETGNLRRLLFKQVFRVEMTGTQG